MSNKGEKKIALHITLMKARELITSVNTLKTLEIAERAKAATKMMKQRKTSRLKRKDVDKDHPALRRLAEWQHKTLKESVDG